MKGKTKSTMLISSERWRQQAYLEENWVARARREGKPTGDDEEERLSAPLREKTAGLAREQHRDAIESSWRLQGSAVKCDVAELCVKPVKQGVVKCKFQGRKGKISAK